MRAEVYVLLATVLCADIALAAGTITQVADVDSGSVVYYGIMCIPPYQFGTADGRIYFRAPKDPNFVEAGLSWVPWILAPPPDTALARVRSLTMTAAQRADADKRSAAFRMNTRVASDVLAQSRLAQQREGLRGRMLMERKAALYRQSERVESVHVVDHKTVLVYFKDRNPPVYRDTEITDAVPATTAEQRLRARIGNDLVSVLQRGGMLIVDYGAEVAVPRLRVAMFKGELSALRGGKEPAESFIKDRGVRARFSSPTKPLRGIVEEGR